MKTTELRSWLQVHWPALRRQLDVGTYRPQPVRRATIPKPSGGERELGVPTALDRLIQQALSQVLTPIFDPGFSERSFGFRSGRSAHQAIKRAQRDIAEGHEWAVDLDLDRFLEPSSHCQRVHGGGVEQPVFGRGSLYSQALSASAADVEGFQLAALDTLQHGLAGDAEGAHRVDDRHVAGRGVLDEQGAELVVDADSPGRAGRVLLAGDEPGLQPAEDRRGGDAEVVGGLADRQQFARRAGSVGGL